MPTKKKLLERLVKQIVGWRRKKPEIEEYEDVAEKEVDAIKAPGIEVEERLKKRWKHEDTEHELEEAGESTDEGLDIEKEEEEGENPYPEIEEAITAEADEEEEEKEKEEE